MTKLVLPSAIGLLTSVNEGIVQRRRLGLVPELTLPKLRSRAWIVVNETSVIVSSSPDLTSGA
jgi:hypothetical protein